MRTFSLGRADRDSGGLEIAARRLATNAGRLFDAAERPAQPPQSENLLPLVIPQDIGHSGGEPCADSRSGAADRKSTRLNSSHRTISYAVFCLKKKKQKT